MSKPLVSIITVVFNGVETIEQTIKSVIHQSYNEIEYIIVDGESTDGTLNIIKKYEEYIDHWVSESDEGLYHAMNKGISLSNGELIGIINSDDWYEPRAIELVVNSYLQNPDKMIFHGDRYDILEDGSRKLYKYNPSEFKFLYTSMTYNHPSMVISKKVYDKHLYNTLLKSYSDYEFILKNYLENPHVFKYIPIAYVNYRLDGISAKQPLFQNIKEGSRARINAGLGLHQVLLFIVLKSLKHAIKSIFGSALLKKYRVIN